MLLRRERNPPLPDGEIDVMVDGQAYVARLVKIACNALTPPGASNNVLIFWFGDQVGEPATDHTVEVTGLDTDRVTLRPLRPPR